MIGGAAVFRASRLSLGVVFGSKKAARTSLAKAAARARATAAIWRQETKGRSLRAVEGCAAVGQMHNRPPLLEGNDHKLGTIEGQLVC